MVVYGQVVDRTKRNRRKPALHGTIRRLRLGMGLSQEAIALACGVDKTAVSHWERGVARPGIGRLARLADRLGVSVDVLLSEVGHA